MKTRRRAREVSTASTSNDVPDMEDENSSHVTDNDYEQNNDESFVVEERPSKKSKTSSTSTSKRTKAVAAPRKKGKLASALSKFPHEVISEICSNLEPIDLIHLAQSSKVFALFLLGPSSAAIWRASRLQLDGFPDCPSGVTEQQYAALVFGNACQRCGKSGIRFTAHENNVLWTFRRRWCMGCRAAVGRGSDPKYRRVGSWGEVSPSADAINVLPVESVTYRLGSGKKMYEEKMYETSVLAEISGAIAKIQESIRVELDQYCQRRRDVSDETNEARRGVNHWLRSRESDRADELNEVRKLRREDLKARMIEDGYQENILNLFAQWNWSNAPTMGLSKRLTKQGYQAIKAKIDDDLGRVYQNIIEMIKRNARRKLCDEYKKILSAETGRPLFRPPIRGIISHPDMQPLFNGWVMENAHALYTSSSDNIEIPSPLLDLLPIVLAAERSFLRDYLFSILSSSSTSPSSSASSIDVEATLDLATSAFTTGSRSYSYEKAMYFGQDSLWEGNYSSNWNEYPWPVNQRLKFHPEMSHIIGNLVEACGLDVKTCTYRELEKRDPYVICLTCCKGDISQSKEMMRWQQTFFHWKAKHHNLPVGQSSWKVATEEEWRSACSDEEHLAHNSAYAKKHVTYSCLLCDGERDRTLNGWSWNGADNHIEHMKTRHGVEDADIHETAIRWPEKHASAPLRWHGIPKDSSERPV